MFAVALLELTLRSILNDIPRDAGSIFAYILLLFIVAVIVYGSRTRGAAAGTPSDPAQAERTASGTKPASGRSGSR